MTSPYVSYKYDRNLLLYHVRDIQDVISLPWEGVFKIKGEACGSAFFVILC